MAINHYLNAHLAYTIYMSALSTLLHTLSGGPLSSLSVPKVDFECFPSFVSNWKKKLNSPPRKPFYSILNSQKMKSHENDVLMHDPEWCMSSALHLLTRTRIETFRKCKMSILITLSLWFGSDFRCYERLYVSDREKYVKYPVPPWLCDRVVMWHK